MKQTACLFAGFGGQGVMFAGQLLAFAGMYEDLEVTWIPSYGPEMRGGTAHCFVMLSARPIGSPAVKYPDIAVVFNNPSFDKYEPLTAAGGLLVANSSLVKRESQRTDIMTLYIPASETADELGNTRLANVVLLGAVLAAHPVVSMESVRQALADHLPDHRRDMLSLNYAALEKGAVSGASAGKLPLFSDRHMPAANGASIRRAADLQARRR